MDIKLRDYQESGVTFLQNRKGAILADEMGLGKTLQAIFAAGSYEAPRDKAVIVVCPKSVRSVWVGELRKAGFVQPQVILASGSKRERERTITQFTKNFINDTHTGSPWFLLLTYDQARLHRELLATEALKLPRKRWDILILDEAHYIKNRKALRTKAVKAIPAERKWLITGTPLQNMPDELWSLLNFMDRKTYSGYWKFVYEYCEVRIDQFGYHIEGGKNLPKLADEISPFFLRRTKEQVAPELPAKIFQTYKVTLNKRQREVYEDLRKKGLAQLDTGAIDVTNVLALFTRMRQICLSTELIGDTLRTPSPKEELILDILEQNRDKRVIVFTTFAQWAKKFINLSQVHAPMLLIGDMNERQRMFVLEQFRAGNVQTLVATVQTGGVGLNLEFVDIAVFADKAWNPTHNQQAEDRLHRITSVKSPLIVSIVTKGTIEEYIEATLRKKTNWHKQVLEHTRGLLSISPKGE